MELEEDSPEEARRAYEEALRLEPALVDAHINLGLLFHRDGTATRGGAVLSKGDRACAAGGLGAL